MKIRNHLTTLVWILCIPLIISAQWQEHIIDSGLNQPSTINSGDFDRDGDEDIVANIYGDGYLCWYENNYPDWVKHTIDMAMAGVSVIPVDLDQDNILDLVVAGFGEDKVFWYKNGGQDSITWTKYTIDDSIYGPEFAEAADFDNDGDLDVSLTAYLGKQLLWYENMGGDPITWTEHIIDAVSNPLLGIPADLDADGNMDIVVTAFGANAVFWYRNGGGDSITWEKKTIDSDLTEANVIDIGDIDGDNDLDVVATDGWNDNSVVWYENVDGTAMSWSKQVIDSTLPGSFSSRLADIDLDNQLDIVATANSSGDVVWYQNLGGNPVAWKKDTIDIYCPNAWDVHLADIDGDQHVDVLVDSWNSNAYIRYYTNPFTKISSQDLNNPNTFFLEQNYPNPFNPSTVISYQLQDAGRVELSVYNILGEKVATLVDRIQQMGRYQVDFDASTFAGGIYFYRLSTGAYSQTKKMLLLK